MAQVNLHKVVKNYDETPAVRGIDLDIPDKEFVVLVGPSGCGKSTTLRIVAGLEEPTTGQVLIDGRRVNDVSAAERGLAMVFQSYALYPHMTVYQNMAFGLENIRTPRSEAGMLLTTVPSIFTSPPEISSSPAIMRSSVDLPQPEGPTNTTNSPSPTSRSTP